MADFLRHIEPLIRKEGGYKLSQHPDDRGGRTYAGISQRSNPNWRGWELLEKGAPFEEIHDATHELYREDYWDPISGDDLLKDDTAEIMFSCAVLSGPRRSVILAQQAVSVRRDGVMGPVTLKAVNEMSVELFECRFALARINRFREICNRDPSQDAFLRGWLNRVFTELAT